MSLLFHVTSTRLMEMPYDTTRVARSRMYGELARNLNDSDADICCRRYHTAAVGGWIAMVWTRGKEEKKEKSVRKRG